jgi:hypothetical protein
MKANQEPIILTDKECRIKFLKCREVAFAIIRAVNSRWNSELPPKEVKHSKINQLPTE